VAGKLSAQESFQNLKHWELLRIFWGVDEEHEEDQTLGGGMIMSDQGVSLRVLNVTELR
jgi:hypothetical protein